MKERDAQEVLAVALEGGPWPVSEVIALVSAATGAAPGTIRRAATDMGVRSVRRVFWVAPRIEIPNPDISLYVEGFPRERLIRHLVCRQEPSASTSERAKEARLDDLREMMGADSVYEPSWARFRDAA